MATAINLIANLIMLFSMVMFIIGVFGRHNEMINNLNQLEHWMIKVALCATAAGAFFDILTLYTPTFSDILLNIGLGLLFLWAAIFHWKYFINNKKNNNEK